MPERVLNPSSRHPVARRGRDLVGPDQAAFAFYHEYPVPLKGIGLVPAGITRRERVRILSGVPCYT
jgi:hypothetical protein